MNPKSLFAPAQVFGLWIFLAVIAVAAIGGSHRDAFACDRSKPCENGMDWLSKFDRFEFTAKSEGSESITARGRYTTNKPSDVQFEIENSSERPVSRMMLIAGQVLAFRDVEVKPGYEIDVLDGAMLTLKLSAELLAVALPNGLDAAGHHHDIKIDNGPRDITVGSASAFGAFSRPWSLLGTVDKPSENRIEFQFVFKSKPGEASSSRDFWSPAFAMEISGMFERTQSRFRIDDAISLAGWSIHNLGPRITKEGGSTTMDFGTTPNPTSFATIADVRRHIARINYTGEPDDTLDLSGAWKTSCKNNFGLLIRKDGETKEYTVAFCGPGACDRPEEMQKTYINKDPKYAVISPSLLRIRGEDHHLCGTGKEWIARMR